MHILLINHYAGSSTIGMEFRPYHLAKEWLKLGHKITIISSSVSHLRQKVDVKKNFTEEIIDGINYLWIKTPQYNGNGIKRVFNIFSFVIKLFFKSKTLCDENLFDLVIASSTYPFDIFPAKRIAKLSKAKLIFEIHDLWPLSPIELGGMSRLHPFVLLAQYAENYSFKHCDELISILPKTKAHCVEHGLLPSKWHHIPNGIVADDWKNKNFEIPAKHNNLLEKLKKEKKFIVGYLGAHGIANALKYLVKAAKIIEKEKIVIVLIGQGQEKKNLIKLSNKLKLSNTYFLPAIPKTMIPTILQQFDCLFIGLQKQSLFRFGISPNKLLDYMMSAKPIIHSVEAGNDLVKESNCGISIEAESPQKIAKAMIEMKNKSKETRLTLGLNGQKFVKKYHDYRQLARKFLDVFQTTSEFS